MLNRHGDRSDRGFIIGAALATLSSIYSLYAREAALDFASHDERLQTEALAESVMELAAYELTKGPNQQPLESSFSFRPWHSGVPWSDEK